MPRIEEYDVWLLQKNLPGMTAFETEIAKQWIVRHANDYDSIEFNVRLGKAQGIPPSFDESMIRLSQAITRQRADIVAHVDYAVDIIECKPRAKTSAIGQLAGYRHLWTDDHPNIPVRRLVVVAIDMDDNVANVYAREGVVYELYPRPGAQTEGASNG